MLRLVGHGLIASVDKRCGTHGCLRAATDVKPLTTHEMQPLGASVLFISPALISMRPLSPSTCLFPVKLIFFMFYFPIGTIEMTHTWQIGWPPSLSCLSVYEKAETLWTRSSLNRNIPLKRNEVWEEIRYSFNCCELNGASRRRSGRLEVSFPTQLSVRKKINVASWNCS